MQILRELGVDPGVEQDLLAPQIGDNPRGYLEPRWMVDLNDEILAALGTTWWKPFPGEDGWHDTLLLEPLRERARALFEEKLGSTPLSGVKDPRMTLTLPLWQQVVPNPLYVICLRNPIDAIASIQRRPDPTLSTHAWGELWLEYTARALAGTTGQQRELVFYADYFRDARGQVARLAALLGMAPDDDRIDRAAALCEGDLRHHRSTPVELAAASGIAAPARTLFLALRAAQEVRRLSSGDAFALQTCDAVEHVAFDAWRASRELTMGQQRAQKVEELRASEQALQASLVQAHDEMDRRYRDLTALQGSLSWRVTAPLRALKGSTAETRAKG